MVKNNRFKILTQNGYRAFKGIVDSYHDNYFEISFVDGSSVECSENHLFWDLENNLIQAKKLNIGISIKTEHGVSTISKIKEIQKRVKLFDIIEVDSQDNHFLLGNKLKTHNCQFITSEQQLIDPDILDFYTSQEPIEEINGFRIFKNKMDDIDGLLVVTIDPSGGGDDSSCIKIFEVAPQKVYEVASFSDPDADASLIFEHLLWLQGYMRECWHFQPDESLVIFERNGIGEGLSQILTHTEKANEQLEFPIYYDDRGKAGIHMTPTLKKKLSLQFKNLFEYDRLKINDSKFIDELYGFVRTGTGGGYAAKSGYHDDHVSATLLMVFFLLTEFSNYVQGAEYSVDSILLTDKSKKINYTVEAVDPAVAYRNKTKQEEEKLIAEAKRLEAEEKKRLENEYYVQLANMSSSSIVDESEDDEDYDKWDIMPTVF